MNDDDFASQVAGVAALAEPLRRALYRYVVAQPGAVSRDEAAKGVGVPRHVARFHLDKLLDEGLLAVEFRRRSGREGPGAGRPAKLYRRSSRQLAVTVPERRYELAGRLMAQAIADSQREGLPVAEAVRRSARGMGRALGKEARSRAGPRPSRAALLAAVDDVLGRYGYQPRAAGDGLALGNCPFHVLARDHTDLVCGMNLQLLSGLLSALEHLELEARLDPSPDRCCVTLAPR